MDFIQSLLPAISQFHLIGYLIGFFVALLETVIGIGLFLPGSTILLFMGALAASGYFDLGDLLLFAAVGAVVGDNINYFLGKRFGTVFFLKGFLVFKPSYFKKGEQFFKRHGPKSIFFGRLVPSVKEVIPLIAGAFGMKYFIFIIWNILGAIAWSMLWILPGYFFAQSIDLAKIWLTRAGFFLMILMVVFVVFYVFKIILIKKGKEFFLTMYSIFLSIKQAVIENKDVIEFVQRHRVSFGFLKNRVNKNKFSGLPLTLFLVAFLYVVSLLDGVVDGVINSNIVVFADIRVANLLAFFRDAQITQFFLWVTLLGSWQIIFIFTIATSIVFWFEKRWQYIAPLLIGVTGGGVFVYIGKIIFHRPRPDLAVYLEKSFSFPSGHATIAVVFYGFLAYVLLKNTKSWKRKINIFFGATLLILAIGFSRLYLGVHYFSDVWGGYLVGAIWLIIAISLSEYFLYKKVLCQKQKTQFITTCVLFVSVFLYVVFAFYYKNPTILPVVKLKQIEISNVMSIFSTNKLRYSETLLGSTQQPLSFIILAKSDNQLVDLFKDANWYLADRINTDSLIKAMNATVWKESYRRAPITPDFWNTKINNFGFEKATDSNNIRTRHHSRFWKTNFVTKDGYNIYIGTASFDSGIKWGVVHRIDPDVDSEERFLFNDLNKTGRITGVQKIQFVDPILGKNIFGDLFFTDGELYLFTIKG